MFLRWVRRGSRTLDSSRRRNSTIANPDKQIVMKIIKLGMYIKYCEDCDYRGTKIRNIQENIVIVDGDDDDGDEDREESSSPLPIPFHSIPFISFLSLR